MNVRQWIINALLLTNKKDEIVEYLFQAIDTLPAEIALDVKNTTQTIQISSTTPSVFEFLKTMYPGIELKVVEKDYNTSLLLFTDHALEKPSITVFDFSFYNQQTAQFELGLGKAQDGVLIHPIDTSDDMGILLEHYPVLLSQESTMPYALGYTDSLQSLQLFLSVLGNDVKAPVLDLYLPAAAYPLLRLINFVPISKLFSTIIIHEEDKTRRPVTVSDTGRTLRIKLMKSVPPPVSMGVRHILLDQVKGPKSMMDNIQTIIDTLSAFHDMKVWTSYGTAFFTNLEAYTHHGSIRDQLSCFQYKKPLLEFKENVRPEMDTIMKFGMVLDQIKDVLEVVSSNKSEKHLHLLQKLNEMN